MSRRAYQSLPSIPEAGEDQHLPLILDGVPRSWHLERLMASAGSVALLVIGTAFAVGGWVGAYLDKDQHPGDSLLRRGLRAIGPVYRRRLVAVGGIFFVLGILTAVLG